MTERTHRDIPEGAAFVERLIDMCEFDEDDKDLGTNGLCAQFALCLYDEIYTTVNCELVLLCDGDRRKRNLPWRHAMIKVDDKYFDIYGQSDVDEALEHYCWSNDVESEIILLSKEEFVSHTKKVKNAYDNNIRGPRWSRKIKESLENLIKNMDKEEYTVSSLSM